MIPGKAYFSTVLGEEHGHRILRVCGKGGKTVLVPLPPAVARAIDRAINGRGAGPVLVNAAARGWTGTLRPAGSNTSPGQPESGCPHTSSYAPAHFVTTMLDAGVDLRDVQIAARHADPRTTMRYDRARKNLDRHPNYILAAYMASGT